MTKPLATLARRTAVALAMASLSTASISCVKENPQALVIVAMESPSPGTCVITPTAGGLYHSQGWLDVTITNQYWVAPLVQNLLPPIHTLDGESQQTSLLPETNALQVKGMDVVMDLGLFYDPANPPDPESADFAIIDRYTNQGFRVPVGAALIDPSGLGAFFAQAVPPDLGNWMFDQLKKKVKGGIHYPAFWITVYLRLAAETQDHWSLHSAEYAFPIQVCWGCLVQFVTNDPTKAISGTIPCSPGQDQAVSNNLCEQTAIHAGDSTLTGFPGATKASNVCNICNPKLSTCGYGCNDKVTPNNCWPL